MGRVYELARVFRSKNAGPFLLTIDIMFSNRADYEEVVASSAIEATTVAELYGVAERDVQIFHFPKAYAIKVVLPRRVSSGACGDRDVYGAQQHGPLTQL